MSKPIVVLRVWKSRGGAHWALMWHFTSYQFLMPEYTHRCRTILIMVPINYWRNSDPFKKKHFCSSNIDLVRAFLKISQIFISKSMKYGTEMFETVPQSFWSHSDIFHIWYLSPVWGGGTVGLHIAPFCSRGTIRIFAGIAHWYH